MDRTSDRAAGALRLRDVDLPLALAEAHRDRQVGDRLEVTLVVDSDLTSDHERRARVAAVATAAGFEVDRLEPGAPERADGPTPLRLSATARLALPDHVGPDMALLCCGLNPSVHAAEAGVGYVTGSNRFWKAMAAAGLATRDRDPVHLLRRHGIGMTDLVARPTPRADELAAEEYRAGVSRLEGLCDWLRPGALVVVGLAGWRTAVDRRARPGWQRAPLGPSPVYLMPSTSGLNASCSLDDLARHLRTAAAGPP